MSLEISRKDIEEKINDRIETGRELRSRSILTRPELDNAINDFMKWWEYNFDFLSTAFSNPSVAKQYGRPQTIITTGPTLRQKTLPRQVKIFQREVDKQIHGLESILERLDFISGPNTSGVVEKSSPNKEVDAPRKLAGDEKVTLAWLFHNVPASLWVQAGTGIVGLIIVVFGFGVKASQLEWVQRLFGNTPQNGAIVQGQQGSDSTSKEIEARIKELTDAHNKHLDELNRRFIEEQKEAGSGAHIESIQEAHAKAAKSYQDAIKEENQSFSQHLISIRQIQDRTK